jgi:hypothetical protein
MEPKRGGGHSCQGDETGPQFRATPAVIADGRATSADASAITPGVSSRPAQQMRSHQAQHQQQQQQQQ